jgi:uncharacterized RDD family membrane protein YckC
MISMKLNSPAPRALRLLAALLPLATFALAADTTKPQDNAAPAPEAPLHEIGAPSDATVTPTPTPKHVRNEDGSIVMHQMDDGENRVSISDFTYVGPEETVPGNAVAVLGSVKVDGTVDGNSVAVMGSNTINGAVHGNVVAVLGSIKLGPEARVDGNVVAVVGTVSRAPGAFVGGHIVKQGGAVDFSDDSGAYSWWQRAARRGRPIAFGPHLHVFWLLSICTIALYVLLALAFPGGVTKCGETLAHRPGITVLTGVLGIIALPVVFILLLITVVGIPIAFVVLPIGVIAAIMFGKAALYALIGRSAIGKQAHPALATLVGAIIMVLFLLVPFIGGMIWIVLAFLGYACALTTLFTPKRTVPPAGGAPAGTPPDAPMAPASPVPPAAMGLVTAVPEAAGAAAQPAAPADPAPPVLSTPPVPPLLARVSEAALPKAGFWIRILALIIDAILIGIVTSMREWFPVALATYAAILWKLRGATIGDIIFGLKVVRVDGAPMEWVTVVVRALACFFSIVVVGLGFIWIAFDRDKQGWHDKIAGTVVVRHPKTPSLV